MPTFDNGVKGYVTATAVVTVKFPINWKDYADICCDQCDFYGRNSKTCQLNKKVVYYPANKIGAYCPLTFEGEVEE